MTATDLAEALAPSGDTSPWAPARVLSVDVPGARVEVDLDGAPVWLRRAAAPYRRGDVVAVVRDPSGGAGQFVAGVLGPVAPAWGTGTITAIDTGAKTITATVGGESVTMPHLSGAYQVGDVVAVLVDHASGIGSLVLGVLPSTVSGPVGPEPPADPSAPTSKEFTALVRPTWSGTWRVARAAWDRWNVDRYGGRSDLYQGAGSGSGTLVGLATFGDRVLELGATELLSVVVKLRHNGSGFGPTAFTVQGSAAGSKPPGAPSFTGDTATSGSIGPGGAAELALPGSVRAGLASGAIKSLGLVGAGYGGVYGTGRPDGMALAVTGRRAV